MAQKKSTLLWVNDKLTRFTKILPEYNAVTLFGCDQDGCSEYKMHYKTAGAYSDPDAVDNWLNTGKNADNFDNALLAGGITVGLALAIASGVVQPEALIEAVKAVGIAKPEEFLKIIASSGGGGIAAGSILYRFFRTNKKDFHAEKLHLLAARSLTRAAETALIPFRVAAHLPKAVLDKVIDSRNIKTARVNSYGPRKMQVFSMDYSDPDKTNEVSVLKIIEDPNMLKIFDKNK